MGNTNFYIKRGNKGILTSVGHYDSLAAVIEQARAAEIPESCWNLITSELDYSSCYYEGDTPSMNWEFPLTVFDK
jgi:ABC-type sugar transport system substrate-binding protein